MKSQQLQLRVSDAEKQAIRKCAARAGMDMSSWVLLALFPAIATRFQRIAGELYLVGGRACRAC